MKRLLIVIILITVLMLASCQKNEEIPNEYHLFQSGLVAAKLNEIYGYVDENGDTKIEFDYTEASAFYKGYAIVKPRLKLEYTIIDTKGKNVIDDAGYSFLYRDVLTGNIIYQDRLLYGLMDYKGEILTEAIYDYISISSENLFRVYKDGLWGYMDTNGDLVIDLKYEYANPFSQEIAVVLSDNQWVATDLDEEIVVDFDIDLSNISTQEKNLINSHYVGLQVDKHKNIVIATLNNFLLNMSLYNVDTQTNIIESKISIESIGSLYAVFEQGNMYVYGFDGSKVDETPYDYFTYTLKYSDLGLLSLKSSTEKFTYYVAGLTSEDLSSYHVVNLTMETTAFFPVHFEENVSLGYVEIFDDYVSLEYQNETYQVNLDVIRQKTPEGFIGYHQPDQKYGLLDYENNIKIDFEYDAIAYFTDGYYILISGDQTEIMNQDFESLHKEDYDKLNYFWNVTELPEFDYFDNTTAV